jgi:hypothetical protein
MIHCFGPFSPQLSREASSRPSLQFAEDSAGHRLESASFTGRKKLELDVLSFCSGENALSPMPAANIHNEDAWPGIGDLAVQSFNKLNAYVFCRPPTFGMLKDYHRMVPQFRLALDGPPFGEHSQR